MTVALAYSRVSSDEQAREGVSLEVQVAEIRRYIARQPGWVLGAEMTDILSGTRDDRPQYQQLLTTARQLRTEGAQVVIVVVALDRLGRRLLERVRSREEFKQLGIAVHSVREGGEVSDLVANILGAVAQEEVRRLGERIRASRAYTRERGWWSQGKAPWGYVWRTATDDERSRGAPSRVIDINPDEVPYVQEVFDRVAGGVSIRQATAWVQGLPSRARGDRRLTYAGLRRVLLRRAYIGEYADGSPGQWPVLLDRTLFDRVQAYIADHRVHRHQASGRFLLTGYLRCPVCGGIITGNGSQSRGRQPYYQCTEVMADARVAQHWATPCYAIDGPVLAAVQDLLTRALESYEAFPTKLAAAWREVQQPNDLEAYRGQRIARLTRDAERARERLVMATNLRLDGDLGQEAYELTRESNLAELHAAETEIARLRVPVVRRASVDFDELLTGLAAVATGFGELAVTEQRGVLAYLITRVVAERRGRAQYDVTITWTEVGQDLQAALARMAAPKVAVPQG